MAMLSPVSRRVTALTGRHSERDVLDRLIEALGAGESRALVLRGEPGVGKTALLEYLVEQAPGFRVVRAAGVQSEMELAFAGLHQLLASMLDRLEGLPAPQSEPLRNRRRRTGLRQHRGNLPAPDRRAPVRFSTPIAARGGRSYRRPATRLARGRAARCLD